MNSPQIPDRVARDRALANLRQTRREMAECNQELVEIEAQLDSPRRRSVSGRLRQLDHELNAQKLARITQNNS